MTKADKEARLQRAYERLGTSTAKCACCPQTNPHCLELHHLPSRAFGEDLVILCRNCHRIQSDDQKDHPRKSCDEPPLGERVAHFLLGLADLFALLATYCREHARQLLEAAGVLSTREVAQ